MYHLLLLLLLLLAAEGSGAHPRWSRGAPSPPKHRLDLHVAVKQDADGVRRLERALWRNADPRDAMHYGRHLSAGAVKRMVAPDAGAFRAVDAWLEGAGVDPVRAVVSHGGDFVRVSVTVTEAERLLPGAQYRAYIERGPQGGRTVHRVADPAAFSLPPTLRAHVDFVEPTVTFPAKFAPMVRREDNANQNVDQNLKTYPSTLRRTCLLYVAAPHSGV